MNKRLFKTILFISMLVLLLTACSKKQDAENEQLQTQVAKLIEENKSLVEENTDLKAKLAELEKNQIENKGNSEGLLKVYTADINSLEKTEIKTIKPAEADNIEKMLQQLADDLSKDCFEGLPIEVLGIEKIEGKDIATINLKEDSQAAVTWEGNFFQGSTGGTITNIALTETFLQKEYKGDWIDGVKFLYENNKLEYDHVILDEIIYR